MNDPMEVIIENLRGIHSDLIECLTSLANQEEVWRVAAENKRQMEAQAQDKADQDRLAKAEPAVLQAAQASTVQSVPPLDSRPSLDFTKPAKPPTGEQIINCVASFFGVDEKVALSWIADINIDVEVERITEGE